MRRKRKLNILWLGMTRVAEYDAKGGLAKGMKRFELVERMVRGDVDETNMNPLRYDFLCIWYAQEAFFFHCFRSPSSSFLLSLPMNAVRTPGLGPTRNRISPGGGTPPTRREHNKGPPLELPPAS